MYSHKYIGSTLFILVLCLKLALLDSTSCLESLSRDSVDDDFCDCLEDSSDELHTSACPNSKFQCINAGFISVDIPSSHVHDGVCDCQDGSDEPTGLCPDNTKSAAKEFLGSKNEEIDRYEDALAIRTSRVKDGPFLKESIEKEATLTVETRQKEIAQLKLLLSSDTPIDKNKAKEFLARSSMQLRFATNILNLLAMVGTEAASKGLGRNLEYLSIADGCFRHSTMKKKHGAPEVPREGWEHIDVEWFQEEMIVVELCPFRLVYQYVVVRDEIAAYYRGEDPPTAKEDPETGANDRKPQEPARAPWLPDGWQINNGYLLGLFSGWATPDKVGRTNKFARSQSYTLGAHCHGFGDREAEVLFECGHQDKITSVIENAKCRYQITLKTPSACTNAEYEHLESEIADFEYKFEI
eukprot:920880_1